MSAEPLPGQLVGSIRHPSHSPCLTASHPLQTQASLEAEARQLAARATGSWSGYLGLSGLERSYS